MTPEGPDTAAVTPRTWWSRYDDQGRPMADGFVFTGSFDAYGNAVHGARCSLGYDERAHRHYTFDDAECFVNLPGTVCLDDPDIAPGAADRPQEGPLPVPLLVFIAKAVLRLHVGSPRLREAMWEAFSAALDSARQTSGAKMPWETSEAVSEVSSAAAIAVMQAMVNVITNIDEGERITTAVREIAEESEREWLAGNFVFAGGEITSTSSGDIRRCQRCNVSIEDRPKSALYCEKHRNARQARYWARKHPPKNKS